MDITTFLTIILGIPGFLIALLQLKKYLTKRKDKKLPIYKKEKNKDHNEYSKTILSKPDILSSLNENFIFIGDLTFPYIPFIASWDKNQNEYRFGDVSVRFKNNSFQIANDFLENLKNKSFEDQDYINNNIYEGKVRYENHNINILSGKESNEVEFLFSKIFYRDFLITNECLDDIIPNTNLTFRDKYFNVSSIVDLSSKYISGICGVGVFIVTVDNKIIISKASNNVKVNPNLLSFSASGTMDWNDHLHPFNEVIRECKEEIGHNINIENLYLISFGLDAIKAYYQFSFVEYSHLHSSKIIQDAKMARDFASEITQIIPLEFDFQEIIKCIKEQEWDTLSSSILLTLCTKKFGKDKIESYLNPQKQYHDFKDQMQFEWNKRAKRIGKSAVLSNRFPIKELDKISKKYINSIINFLIDDIEGKSVIEVGCGIGLLTKEIIEHVSSLTCIDLCEKMIERNKEFLNGKAKEINYVHSFVQDYKSPTEYDALICSLVLVHNTNNDARAMLINKMKELSRTIFLFEPIDTGIQASKISKHLNIEKFLDYFYEYKVIKRQEHMLFTDKIIFLKLER